MDRPEYTYEDLQWRHRMLKILGRMSIFPNWYFTNDALTGWEVIPPAGLDFKDIWKTICRQLIEEVSTSFTNCSTFADEMIQLFDWIGKLTKSSSPSERVMGKVLAEAFNRTFPNRDANDGPMDLKDKWKEYSLTVYLEDGNGKVKGKDSISFEAPSKQHCFDALLQACLRQQEAGSDAAKRWTVFMLSDSETQESLTTEFLNFAEPLL